MIVGYFILACIYYYHNRQMGGIGSGVFMALLWFIVVIFWIIGYVLVWQEEREIRKLL